jgi:hypothetical protein
MNSMTQTPDTPPKANIIDLLQRISMQLGDLTELLEDHFRGLHDQIAPIAHDVDGFTNSGASFGAYQVDAYTQAYLSLLGPLLAVRLQQELGTRDISELMKAAAPLTRDALEELGAYRETQQGRDALSNALSTMGDVWKEETPGPVEGDWQDLES